MALNEAYCKEMASVVDIYAAQQYYFDRPEPRKRLIFLCSDDRCREVFKPTVTGVLYDRPITDLDATNRMQFKWGPNAEHAPDCPWVERRAAAEKARTEGKGFNQESNRRLSFSDIESEDVIDIFTIGEPTDYMSSQADREFESSTRLISSPIERIARYSDHFRERFSSTSRLEQVVNCHKKMTLDEREQATLNIPTYGRKSYAQYFQKVGHWHPGDEARIYMGGASLREVSGGYRLSFYDKAKAASEDYQVSLYLTNKRIEDYSRRGILKAQLKALLSGEYDYARCYFFGTISRSERTSGAVIFADANIESLHHLVLILKTKARK